MSTPLIRSATMTTRYGDVAIHAIGWPGEQPYVVLRHPAAADHTLLRLQAHCLTSTAFAALMCDCGSQIEAGVRLAATRQGGTLVYLPQEGRGYGLFSKVEILAQMNGGLSLAAAQQAVGRAESRLSYHRVPQIISALALPEPITLLTESTAKVRAVKAAGVPFAGVGGLS